MSDPSADRETRERDFWDHVIPTLDECVELFYRGPAPNTRLMLDRLEPLEGRSVLDFACGVGITSAWLAQRGARVVGIDISPNAVSRAGEVAEALGLDVELITGPLGEVPLPVDRFDRLCGHYALHHIDCVAMAPIFASVVAGGGRAVFVETMASNPVLRVARRRLVGRFGIPRFGSDDEKPLDETDLDAFRSAFGHLELDVAQLTFLDLLDRQVFQYRHGWFTRLAKGGDELLRRLGAGSWSYHQVVYLEKTREDVR